jgi:hypothetical protein
MSTENTNIDVTATENLDDFAANLFGGSEAQPSDDATSEEVEAEEVEDDATNEDTHSADDGATEDDESEEEPTDEDDQPKKGNRFQERINELTAARREAEREAAEVRRKLDEVLKRLDESTKPAEPETKPVQQEATNTGAPQPTDKNADGTHKYPLGEFDPKFLRDTVEHMLNTKQDEQKREQQEYEQQQELLRQRQAVEEVWEEKLIDARERYPDYQEKGQELIDSFAGIDEQYGQYLTDTIMEMDAGPDVFYYLANNPEEAKQIVNAGPRKATIALAKLEAQFVSATPETKAVRTKTTKAPPPPPQLKGSSVARASTDVNTDDLDAFTKALFKTKKK